MSSFDGVGVALITPFKQDLEVDYDALERVVNHCIEKTADYLVVCGTTGESATLSDSEKIQILNFIGEINNRRLPLVFGIGGNNTANLLSKLNGLSEGLDAILSVSPYYNKPSQDGIIKHYSLLADHSKLPIILYNVPGRTSSNLSWEATVALSKHPKIIGIKEASGDLTQCQFIKKYAQPDFKLISGDDLLTIPMMAIGGSGVISVLANAFDHFKKALNLPLALGNELLMSLININPLMYVESNPVGIKEVLCQMGICENYVRLPLIPASDGLKRRISKGIEEIGKA